MSDPGLINTLTSEYNNNNNNNNNHSIDEDCDDLENNEGSFITATNSSTPQPLVPLTEHRIKQRQKQIDLGKNTRAYDRYISLVPKAKRRKDHPKTPNKYLNFSKRAFDGLIRLWRRVNSSSKYSSKF